MEWVEVGDLAPGEFFTLGESCPLTFVVRDRRHGRAGRLEVDTTVLAGNSAARSYAKTMYRPNLEVLIVPEEVVGERVAGAVAAFAGRNFNGLDRVELADNVWPYVAADSREVAA